MQQRGEEGRYIFGAIKIISEKLKLQIIYTKSYVILKNCLFIFKYTEKSLGSTHQIKRGVLMVSTLNCIM